MKASATLYALLRWAAAALALVFIFLLLSGSGLSEADPELVSQAVLEQLDLSEMQPAEHQMVKRLYGLAPADYEGLTLYYPVTNMGAEEVLVVKLKDPAQADAVCAAIEKRLDTQKTSFDGYGIAQYDLLTNHSIIEVRGNFILFVVSQSAEQALAAFRGAL